MNAVGLKRTSWSAVSRCGTRSSRHDGSLGPTKSPRDVLADTAWHEVAQSRLLLSIESRIKPAGGKGDDSSTLQKPLLASDAPSLVVCRSPILRTTDRYDKDEVDRHLVLEEPLPLSPMPSAAALRVMQRLLVDEFPWAGDVLAIIFGELNGQAALGVRVLGMPPTLLVGLPGSGKSRLARRIADELGVPRLDLPLGGSSDTKVLGGTSRGWASGKPSDLATLMATRRSASAIVLLDELDKAVEYQREGSGLQSYLLALLEPETASRHTDVFLKTSCDYSSVLWLATANPLTPIAAPLLSRMRVLKLDQPEPEHFPIIAENVIAETAQRWSLERWAMPETRELDLPWDRITSARQLRVATEQAVASWARAQNKALSKSMAQIEHVPRGFSRTEGDRATCALQSTFQTFTSSLRPLFRLCTWRLTLWSSQGTSTAQARVPSAGWHDVPCSAAGRWSMYQATTNTTDASCKPKNSACAKRLISLAAPGSTSCSATRSFYTASASWAAPCKPLRTEPTG